MTGALTMLNEFFQLEKPAALMASQGTPDLGRLAQGLPAGGSMDPWAPVILNRLLDLEDSFPVLELTLAGPVITAKCDVMLALGGLEGSLESLPVWEPFHVRKGDTLNLRKIKGSSRLYLAASTPAAGKRLRTLQGSSTLRQATCAPVHIIANPVFSDHFALPTLRLSPQSDRRGLRLEASGALPPGHEIPPEPMGYGAIQMPPGGAPIIVGPDGPVTGGYARIATVACADLRRLAWLMPGQAVDLKPVSRDDAVRQYRHLEEALAQDLIPC
ncbi:MAG: hypothetical protein RIQ81_1235 [Pseudomonadota bacterium]|jgi:allophanate hydrolase subunit 2